GGRLAACFVDSLATLQIPAVGYGLRYEYGIFRQEVRNGYQVELPDHWLGRPDPWEVVRHARTVEVPIHSSFELRDGHLHAVPARGVKLLGVPHDRPVVGYGGRCINTLRLWAASSTETFDFRRFSKGDLIGADLNDLLAESLIRALYPDDSTQTGQMLRFVQEYFLVACSLADIIARFRRRGNDWRSLPDKVAIQLNDTHPALAGAELMHILLDQAGVGWPLPGASPPPPLPPPTPPPLPGPGGRGRVCFSELPLPRQLKIIYETTRRFLDQVRARYPGDTARLPRMSLVEEPAKPG